MENPKAKVVGFITIILILSILVFITFKIVNKNQEKKNIEEQTLSYQKEEIDMKLNGDYIEYIPIGEIYEEKGITAFEDNVDISDDVSIFYYRDNVTVRDIDTKEPGNYLVKYLIKTSKGNKLLYKSVIVLDNKKPIIKFPKSTIISVDEVDTFNYEQDVEVTDNIAVVNLIYEGKLEAKEGNYIITYKATDSTGNKAIKKRLIKVTK